MAWNNKKTPRYDVTVQKSGTKKRKTICTHAYPEWELECSFVALDKRQVDKIAGFFCSQYGVTKAFLWYDMEDYRQAGIQFGIGDGVTQRFQLLRSWADLFYEPVYDILTDSLMVYQNEARTAVTLEDNGIVYFSTPPAAGIKLAADFYYYWRVAFDSDITWEMIWYNLYNLNSFKLVSVR
jgi:uncharacterized protein (TIGR02217 family)